ncbi:phage holin family protein [Xenorhabdus szentirmaii]|uniref:Inner membrane protein yqjE n=2 Tax=Xenorhabdus szentirmaii TaxID=290112 RepID=W1IYT7_9GAMM|nr:MULTISPECIES: phage holin family protein [Xenorhabdus]MBD2779321.1 phage holin family protein [Xenorhabdus sp. 38]MBD2791274.1 phage holin family protein [Xenorhabdus sp. CUL]MBD2802898.1 phage holin family protein [Xenorhabdus sp. M]MBD2804691.1 phage holin family protein [Xenorhabdus sp. ZM]MBD2821969.1 phage holin family protein [Xenorhabdus sp. 42]
MTQSPHSQGLGKGLFGILRKMAATLVRMVETRIQLAAVELEEGAATLIQLLLMVGFTLLFAGLGLICLLVLLFWVIDPLHRVLAMIVATGILLFLAVLTAIMTLRKTRKLTFLNATREQLNIDYKTLKDSDHE